MELVYGNNTVYFAQPSPSQFVHGGSGVGTFDQPVPLGPQETLKINLALPGRNTPKSDTSTVLRYALSAHQRRKLTSWYSPCLDTPNGESGFTARSCLTLKSTCEATRRTLPWTDLLICTYLGYRYRINHTPTPLSLKISSEACMGCLAWTYRRYSLHRISTLYTRISPPYP